MASFTAVEIRRREDNLISKYDAKNLGDLAERRPDIVEAIKALLEVGHGPDEVGRVIRRKNPQMWIESKFAESVARAILEGAE